MKEVIAKYQNWKKENPDESYQYDEIFDFVDCLSRGELIELLEWAEEHFKN